MHLRRRALLSALVAAVAVVTALSAPASSNLSGPDAAPATALVALVAPTSSHPYSDPAWFPLHAPARVSCVRSNCPGPYHGYWAMDLLGNLGDPVYAAGAGVFHVGAIDATCRTSTNDSGGTWVWVDHGGGKVSRYHHLSSVSAKEGQLVTPATVIGRMGHSGDIAPCTTNYLHFEVRVHGLKGDRVDPGRLFACQGATKLSWPTAWGKTSWDQLTARSVTTPSTDSTCVPETWRTTPARPASVSVARGSTRLDVSWPAAPAGTNRIVVTKQTFHPSVPEWGAPEYTTLPATSRSLAFAGLQNGRPYRFQVSYHNSGGSSAWTGSPTATPAAAPTVPRAPRWLTATSSKIRYAWWKSTAQGTPVTSYTVRVRKKLSTGYSAWRNTAVSPAVLNHNWLSVTRGRTYQVEVRANSSAGSSAWSSARSVRVPR